MLFILPTAIAGPDDLPGSGPPSLPTPAAWIVAGLLMVTLTAERLAVVALGAWTWLPETPARLVATLSASLRLYPSGSENAAGSWWTYALFADDLWQALASVLLLTVLLRACERWLGAVRTLALVAAALPLIGVVWALAAQIADTPPVIAGAVPLATALIAAVRVLHPRAELRWVVGWWLVVLVAVVPLRLGLVLAATAIIAQDALRCGLLHGWGEVRALLVAHAAALLIGGLLGLALRWAGRRHPGPAA